MAETLWCSEKIGKGGWYRYQCRKSVAVTRDGKLYCGTHDPEKVAAREQKKKLQQDKDNIELKNLHDRAVRIIDELGMGRPDGYRYDTKNPVRGITLTFTEAEHLIIGLQRGGSK